VGLTPGSRLGAYEILGLLGSGGMGEVYRARDLKLGRDVAIKVLPQTLGDDPDRLARFEREARTLAALSHQNIAHVHGFDDSAGVPALVMEIRPTYAAIGFRLSSKTVDSLSSMRRDGTTPAESTWDRWTRRT